MERFLFRKPTGLALASFTAIFRKKKVKPKKKTKKKQRGKTQKSI